MTAKATEKPTQYLGLANAGAYVIKPVKLHWKTPAGEKHTHTYNTRILNGGMFCEGLKKFGLIEEGSEVWLTANIVLGGSSNRRKSNPRVYQPNGKVQFYKMLGEVQTKNRCKQRGKNAGRQISGGQFASLHGSFAGENSG